MERLKTAVAAADDPAKRAAVRDTVATVIDDVRRDGDTAVRMYSKKFDNWSPEQFRLTGEEIDRVLATVPAQTLADIRIVQANVRDFAQRQLESLHDFEVEPQPGVLLGQKTFPCRPPEPTCRTVPARRLGAHDRGDGEGWRPRPSDRGHPADPRHGPGRDRRGHASCRCRRDPAVGWCPRRGGHGGGHRDNRQFDLLVGPGKAYVAEAKRQPR